MAITKEYKESSFGKIPIDWQELLVEDLVINGILEKPLDGNHGNIHPTSSDFVKEGIPFIMANSVQDGILDLTSCHFIKKEQADKLQKGFSKAGDVLFTHKGTVGNTAIVENITTEYIMLTPQVTYYRILNDNKLNRYYLKYFFDSEIFKNILKVRSGGGTRAYIGITNQRKLPILLPKIDEQKEIAQILCLMDNAIRKNNQLIIQKELRKIWLMQNLLSGKKRLQGFHDNWIELKLGAVCNLVNGMSFKPEDWTNIGIPIIRIQNLNGSNEYNYFNKEVNKRHIVKKGDLLFAWSGSRGTSFGAYRWHGNDAILNQHIFNVYPKNGLQINFLYYILRWLTIRIERKAHGSAGLVHVTKKQLENEIMILPKSKDEQNAIANILIAFDKEINLLKLKSEKLSEQKKGLMQVLLSGKKRLKKDN